ncbi:MAG: hypothetical protein K0B00_06850 [Rhodobacteraceae bacterium]|nr:hypothetical protein [Paracoccaceae bacterium]
MRNPYKLASVAAALLVVATSGYVILRPKPPVAAVPVAAAPNANAAIAADTHAAAPALPAPPRHAQPPEVFATAPACAAAVLTVSPAPQAMLAVQLQAPCQPGARVELRHGGLAVAVQTDVTGSYTGLLPALAREARLEVTLPDGARLAARVRIGDIASVERVALLSGATGALHLHAFENGAGFGDAGHRSAAAPGAPGQGTGGYLTLLGDAGATPPLLAEVYTAPAGLPPAQLAVQADVSAATCGTDLGGIVLRMGGAAQLALTLAMPACDGIDGAVLLPLPDVPLALALADQI